MEIGDTRPLVMKTRGSVTELIHRGAYAIVSTQGELLYACGNPAMRTYLRSSAKPFQMLPVVERGAHERYGLTQKELAVIAASHSGEPIHIETIRGILSKATIPESALQCGPHLPLDAESAHDLIRRGAAPQAVHSNCSGKHTGMLIAAHSRGEPLEPYLEYDHPLQQEILRAIGALSEVPIEQIPISRDGCGAPIFALPVERVARLFALLARPEGLPERRAAALRTIRDAMMAFPYLVSGKGRLDVRLMEAFPGRLVCKSGALGVFGIGLPELGVGIALKIEDGDATTRTATVIRALKRVAGDHLGVAALDALWSEFCPPIVNTRGETVGEVIWIGDETAQGPIETAAPKPGNGR